MLRARQTAAPLERLTGVTATVEDGLTEIAYGEWEGLTVDRDDHQRSIEAPGWRGAADL